MAIYTKSKKIEETEESVIYAYGGNPDNLDGIFLIKKDLSDWKLIQKSTTSISGVIYKICKCYKEEKYFPDEVSCQS